MPDAKRRVLVLDDDRDFCELIGAFLESSADVECLAVHSLQELVQCGERALECELAILDVNLGPGEPSGIEALEWLRENAFAGRVAFLTGHARRHPRLHEEADKRGLTVFEKPIDAGTLVGLVQARATGASTTGIHGGLGR